MHVAHGGVPGEGWSRGADFTGPMFCTIGMTGGVGIYGVLFMRIYIFAGESLLQATQWCRLKPTKFAFNQLE